jgi:hypothetical protein
MQARKTIGLCAVTTAAATLSLASIGAAQTSLASINPVSEGYFGGAVAAVPDVNGDGFADLAVGASNETSNGIASAGRVYVYSGSNGALLRTLSSPNPRLSGLFGSAVAGVADVNGDGRGDIIVGAPQESSHDVFASGRAYVYSGATGGLIRQFTSPARRTGGRFGTSVAGVPDVNGDGRGDVLIGAPGEAPSSSPPNAGRAHLFSGATGAFRKTFIPPRPQANGSFGYCVAGVPDLNGDGFGDIAIGAPRENPLGTPVNSGRVHIYSGATGLRRVTVQSPGIAANGFFGSSVAGMADANGDGRGDFIVGAPFEHPGASPLNCGRAYIYSGINGQLFKKLLPPTPVAEGQFGISVAGIPDTNVDGRGDVIVGGWQEGTAPAQKGQAHVYSGAQGVRLFTLTSPNPVAGGRFGVSVAGLLNAGGTVRGDLSVGASTEGAPSGPVATGRAYIYRR